MGLAQLACCAFERGGVSGVVLDATTDAGAAGDSLVYGAVKGAVTTHGPKHASQPSRDCDRGDAGAATF